MKRQTNEELKTLKDLEFNSATLWDKIVTSKRLKAEAVKWVKQEDFNIYDKEWIKHFFNLTEEDLK